MLIEKLNVKVQKLNESFYAIDLSEVPSKIKEEIARLFSVEIKNARFDPEVQGGWKSDREYFFRMQGNVMIIPCGLINFLTKYGIHKHEVDPVQLDYTEKDILDFIDNLGFAFKLYDHQTKAIVDCLLNKKQLAISCTGSGKSAIISIICEFLRLRGLKGLVLVPSISLVTQIHKDFLDYNLQDLYNNVRLIGGDNTNKSVDKPLVISTWQSMQNMKEVLEDFDYVITDECHTLRGPILQDILNKCINASYKLGLTGTLPEDPYDRMAILSLIGIPITYIKTQGLIELGLATPVSVNIIKLKYSKQLKDSFKHCKGFVQQLGFIKESEPRISFISNLAINVTNNGNSIVLFQHVEHGKQIFMKIFKDKTGLDIENKDITGKNAFEFQKKHSIYFINGAVEGKVRELIRNILEIDENAILVGNYSCISTGINIKQIHNIIFASPMKSFVQITQSIGRGIRLHKSKAVMNLYDLTDDFKPFLKQMEYRKKLSYLTEGFPIYEREFNI